jgi:hypothetical protein
MNCGSASEGFSVATWLGDAEADYPIYGSIDEIKTQVKAAYKKDHPRDSNLTSTTTRSRREVLDIPLSTTNNYMTDVEAASIRKSCPKVSPNNEALS